MDQEKKQSEADPFNSGDVDWVTNFDWTVADQPDGVRLFEPVVGTMNPPDGAADVIYAGDATNDSDWRVAA